MSMVAEQEAVMDKEKPKSPFRTYRQGPNDPEPVEVPSGMTNGVFRVEDPRTDEQILKGEFPKPLTQEDKDRIYDQMREQALIKYHIARAKALVGNPEGYSLPEIQQISDLFPMRTINFDEWWKIQLARETEAMKAQAKKS